MINLLKFTKNLLVQVESQTICIAVSYSISENAHFVLMSFSTFLHIMVGRVTFMDVFVGFSLTMLRRRYSMGASKLFSIQC